MTCGGGRWTAEDLVGAGDVGFNVLIHVGLNNGAGGVDGAADGAGVGGAVRFEDIAL